MIKLLLRLSIRGRVKYSFLLILFFSVVTLKGQYALDSLDLDGNLYSWYDQSLGLENTGIVMGSYEKPNQTPFSNPFFEVDSWDINCVKYRGMVFENVHVMYDIQKDHLLVRHPTDYQHFNSPIKLSSEQVEWFTINDHIFKYHPESILAFKPGFYEEVYIGENVQFIIKHSKRLMTDEHLKLTFEEGKTYLIKHNGEYSNLKGKKSLLRRFDDDKELKKKLKKFIKKNGIGVRKSSDLEILILVEFLEEQLVK